MKQAAKRFSDYLDLTFNGSGKLVVLSKLLPRTATSKPDGAPARLRHVMEIHP